MKKCNRCGELKELVGFYADKRKADGHQSACKTCAKKPAVHWWQMSEADREKATEHRRRWLEVRREKQSNYQRRYCEANAEKVSEKRRRYRKANPDKFAQNGVLRRTREQQACVPWADKAKIAEAYRMRDTLTEMLGVAFHVDHVVPLKGKTVCGLHVHNNLQVITATENLRKNNKFARA